MADMESDTNYAAPWELKPAGPSKLEYFFQVLRVVIGAVLGTISLCGIVANAWGVIGWTFSIISVVRLLSISHRKSIRQASPPSITGRVVFASLAVFCLIFLTAMATAFNANPQRLELADIAVLSTLVVVGVMSGTTAFRMVWK